MSRLSTHQIRAMIPQMEATLRTRKQSQTATSRAIAKLDNYRAELATREAQEAEETHSQAEPREETDPGAPTIHLAPRHHPITPPAAPAEPPRAEPDDDLTLMLRAALTRYTLGTVLDEAWAVEAKLFGTLATPRETRTRKARTA